MISGTAPGPTSVHFHIKHFVVMDLKVKQKCFHGNYSESIDAKMVRMSFEVYCPYTSLMVEKYDCRGYKVDTMLIKKFNHIVECTSTHTMRAYTLFLSKKKNHAK